MLRGLGLERRPERNVGGGGRGETQEGKEGMCPKEEQGGMTESEVRRKRAPRNERPAQRRPRRRK